MVRRIRTLRLTIPSPRYHQHHRTAAGRGRKLEPGEQDTGLTNSNGTESQLCVSRSLRTCERVTYLTAAAASSGESSTFPDRLTGGLGSFPSRRDPPNTGFPPQSGGCVDIDHLPAEIDGVTDQKSIDDRPDSRDVSIRDQQASSIVSSVTGAGEQPLQDSARPQSRSSFRLSVSRAWGRLKASPTKERWGRS